jgi:hypothetical protein
MGVFLNKVMRFFLLAIVVYLSVVLILGKSRVMFKGFNFFPVGPSRTVNRIEDLSAFKELNILFMGSSHAYMSFDPRIFKKEGYNAFNFGSSSQTPLQGEFLYSKYLENVEVDLIVYEICPLDITDPGVESNIDFLNSIELDFALIKMTLHLKTFRSTNTMVFCFLNQGLGNLPTKIDHPSYIHGTGYAPIFGSDPNSERKQKRRKSEVNSNQYASLMNMINAWKKNGQKFLFVQAPVTREFYNSIPNSEELDSIFSHLGPYINYNNSEKAIKLGLIDTTHFFNSHHLNQRGVEKFNQLFLADVHNLFPRGFK